MEHVHLLEIVMEVLPLVGAEDTKGKANQGPKMDNAVLSAIVMAQLVDLGVAVMTGCDAVVGLGGLDLVVLGLSVGESLLLKTGLEEAAAAAAAEVVGFVGGHVDEVLFSDNGLDNKPKVVGHGVAKGLSGTPAKATLEKRIFTGSRQRGWAIRAYA